MRRWIKRSSLQERSKFYPLTTSGSRYLAILTRCPDCIRREIRCLGTENDVLGDVNICSYCPMGVLGITADARKAGEDDGRTLSVRTSQPATAYGCTEREVV